MKLCIFFTLIYYIILYTITKGFQKKHALYSYTSYIIKLSSFISLFICSPYTDALNLTGAANFIRSHKKWHQAQKFAKLDKKFTTLIYALYNKHLPAKELHCIIYSMAL